MKDGHPAASPDHASTEPKQEDVQQSQVAISALHFQHPRTTSWVSEAEMVDVLQGIRNFPLEI